MKYKIKYQLQSLKSGRYFSDKVALVSEIVLAAMLRNEVYRVYEIEEVKDE